ILPESSGTVWHMPTRSTSAPEELPNLCKDDLRQIELCSCDEVKRHSGAFVAVALHWQPLA
ncbi:MAG: hypothetical protein ABIU20_02410, partial [Blastocatellia bacterium]